MSSKSKTKVACKFCNLRRVKCDRTEDRICTNCQVSGQDCQPIISRRGKYKRSNVKNHRTQAARQSAEQALDESCCSLGDQHPVNPGRADPSPAQFGTGEGEVHGLGQGQSDSGFIDGSNHAEHKTEVVYYGDSFNLEYVLHEMGNPFQGPPDSSSFKHSIEELYYSRLGQSTKDQINAHERNERTRLEEMGAFESLDKDISDALLQRFFKVIYPLCPIFDRAEFSAKYQAGRISPLVLQSVYFVAAAHCEPSLVEQAGFPSRYMATFTFYQRAKALYDTNHESDAIATLQALYLLSHWWGSPLEQKDTWYWMGLAVGLAQALGLHQRKAYIGLPERQRRLWRRIWWTVYSHDILIAVTLGRTPHVNDAYCNVPLLSEEDVEDDDNDLQDAQFCGPRSRESRLYLVYLVDMAKRASQCLLALFGADSDESTIQTSLDRFSSLQSTVPRELRRNNSTISLESGYWSSLAHLSYNAFQILLYRNGFQYPSRLMIGSLPYDAAVNIVRILEDMMSSEILTLTSLRTLPAVFASLSVHIANISGNASDVSELSKHRARFCMLVLRKLQDSWPPLLWYYNMFLRILQRMGCEIPDEGDVDADLPLGRSLEAMTGHLSNAPSRRGFQGSDGPEAPYSAMMQHIIDEDVDLGGMMDCFPFSSILTDNICAQGFVNSDDRDG